jgi:hypothetical protein
VYDDGSISFLRRTTGLQIHHYHYGIIILAIALLVYLFLSKNRIVVALLGFGLGSILDSFVSGLLVSHNRMQEIINYNMNLWNTIIIFGIVVVLCVIFYLVNKRSG